ncbi:MAG TPA: glycosyltransferase family 2 protein, partial [Rugosimonospora sp.]|nr:glycosyltransferase family 2 protein [Rugosimonospora sp.]
MAADSWTAEPGDDQPRVAVVIVTFNSAEVLGGCLRSLTSVGVDIPAVVVVDNASRDGSVALAESTAGVPVTTVQMGRNAGYAAALNAGIAALDIRKLTGVFVMNPDCRLRPDTLKVLADALREPGRGLAVPLMLNPDGTLQPSLRRAPTVTRAIAEAVVGGERAGRTGRLGELITDPHGYERPGPVVWATGAAVLVAAEAVRDIGPWDESFLLYSEETEYMLRAADRGWSTWYEPAAVVEHIGGESGTNPLLAALLIANKVELFRRRHNPVSAAAYHGAVLLGELMRAAAGR